MRRNTHFLQRLFLTILATAMLVLPVRTSPAQQTAEAPVEKAPQKTLDERLAALVEKLDTARVEHHVPGLGLAIVKDGEVVLCTGLGQANIEKDIKATADTVFAIGSTTKAFTATLVGTLVDDGEMDWDDKVSKYLPGFHMKDPEADANVTLRDMLCHRSGLARMDLLWAAGTLTREEILAACAIAEPLHGFREKFEYSNTNFIAAGEAAAKAGGASWENLVRERLLKPLKMTNTTLSVEEAKKDPNFAVGYSWDDVKNDFKKENVRDIISAAPAGSINSSPRDMANWIQMQLAHGEFQGTRVIDAETLEETWKPHVLIAPGVSYGLGWMVEQWNGRRMIEHGGNIDGFAASVGFLPDDNLGFVLLTNVSFTQLQFLGKTMICEALLGEETPHSGGELDYEPYLGKYVADFGPFRDARFTVQVKNDNLAVDVPGQTVYELKNPNDEGKWYFQITDTIAVSFDRDDVGEVNIMKMHQSGLAFELPREGYTPPVEVAKNEVREYLGKYHFSQLDADAEVLHRNGRLAIDVPGEMIYDLHKPDDEGKWVFRANDKISIEFNRNDDERVESLTLNNHGMSVTLPRVTGNDEDDEGEGEDALDLDEVIAQHLKAVGNEHLPEIKTMRMVGTINFIHQGITGTIEVITKGMNYYRNHIDLGRSGTITVIVADNEGWSASSFDPTEPLEGKYLKSAQAQHPLLVAADWRDYAKRVTLGDSKTINERLHYMVNVKVDEIIDSEIAIDAETGLVTGENLTVAAPGIGALPMKLRYSDYRQAHGLMMPMRATLENAFHGKAMMEFDTIEINVDLPDDTFNAPADVTADASE